MYVLNVQRRPHAKRWLCVPKPSFEPARVVDKTAVEEEEGRGGCGRVQHGFISGAVCVRASCRTKEAKRTAALVDRR